ncbi:MAG: ATP synthase F1 subunit epsilon [Bacteroidales bacterium]|nr:ATP synthase F1 subunit epsilon [Bacteroidales bacterium]MCF8334758.1 ATP synthase F1 subunit epsilon [Bacteroidales bacterium]
MNLEILTPETTIYKGEASLVQLPGIDGLFEILNNHAPLISVLSQGKVKIRVDDELKYFDIKGGVVEVKNNRTLVLAE